MPKPAVPGLLLAIAACATVAWAQPARVGTVATVVGAATVARGVSQQPLSLKLRDDVFLHDRITTGERSFLRVLLGGKATVTARERSVLTITEAPAVSRIGLASGGIAVAVSKDRMKPGEAVEIRLPNALAVIRGTVVIAEVSPTRAGARSTVTILRGSVEVTRLDPAGRPVGASVRVGALERITVEGSGSLAAPERITPAAAAGLYAQFTVIPRDAPRSGREAAASVAADLARVDALQFSGAAVSVGVGTGGAASATVGTGGITVPDASTLLGGSTTVGGVSSTVGTSDVGTPGGPTLPVGVPSIPNPLSPGAPLAGAPVPSPALPTPALPTTALPTPALPTPALPTPALPTPALPTPALPTPALPTPALPTPAPPTPALPTPLPSIPPLPRVPTPKLP